MRGLVLHNTLERGVGISISLSLYAAVKWISGISDNWQSLSGPRSSEMEDQAWAQTGHLQSFDHTAQLDKFYNHVHDKQFTRGKALKACPGYKQPRSLHFITPLCQAFPCCISVGLFLHHTHDLWAICHHLQEVQNHPQWRGKDGAAPPRHPQPHRDQPSSSNVMQNDTRNKRKMWK